MSLNVQNARYNKSDVSSTEIKEPLYIISTFEMNQYDADVINCNK